MSDDHIRLSKLMAQRGLCSRREADKLIEAGQVLVNGELCDQLGVKVSPNCQIQLRSEGQQTLSSKVTILFNKPLGLACAPSAEGYPMVQDEISAKNQSKLDRLRFKSHFFDPKTLNIAGRLDINSKGLVVLTNNGTIVRQLIRPDSPIEKEYFVGVQQKLSPPVLQKLEQGLSLDGRRLKPARVLQKSESSFTMTLTEGRKRQIRRMCEQVGLDVATLKRVRIGQVQLGSLKEGEWRFLMKNEGF